MSDERVLEDMYWVLVERLLRGCLLFLGLQVCTNWLVDMPSDVPCFCFVFFCFVLFLFLFFFFETVFATYLGTVHMHLGTERKRPG